MDTSGWIDSRALQRAIVTGAVLQMALAILSHFNAWVEAHAGLFATMMVSATAGYLYAMDVAKGYARGSAGGTMIGGACVIPALALSVALRDLSPSEFVLRMLVCILTGAVGGVFGQMAADWTRATGL